MFGRAALTFLLYISSLGLFAQQKNLHSLQMICLESKVTPGGAFFKLSIINNTADTFLIPKKILPGPINSGMNLGYEVQYIDECSISTDLTKNLFANINYNTILPWNAKQNIYSLLPGKERIIEQFIDDGLLEKKGNYLVRFSIRKETMFHSGVILNDDLKSEWIKIKQIKDKVRRSKSDLK